MFPSDMRIPAPHFSRMLLRDFMISYRPVYPGDKGSPLREDIDNTVRLELAYDQNTFSLEAVSINYDYPSNILYSWKLEGLYEGWSHPVQSGGYSSRACPQATTPCVSVPSPMRRNTRCMRKEASV
mgnify:CR=1 FL=1